MTLGLQAGVKTCDDCTTEYAGPAYYTFPPSECRTSRHDGPSTPHAGCTGNLCPRCAGPDLEPDRAGDPRRPAKVAPRAPRTHGETRPDRGWRSPNPARLRAENTPRGRMERAAAEATHRSGASDVAIGTLLLARGFYAWNGNDDACDDACDALTAEIEARKRESEGGLT